MTKLPICDICKNEIKRKRGRLTKKPTHGEGSLVGRTPLLRRFFSWVLGPLYRWKELGRDKHGAASYNRIDLCCDCRWEIAEKVGDSDD